MRRSVRLSITRGSTVRIGIDIRKPDWSEGQQRYLWRLGLWMARRGHEVAFINSLRDDSAPELPEGVRLHQLGRLSRAGLRRAVRGLELDVLLLNPEKSRRYGGLAANLLRPGYGTDHYSQKLESFRDPLRKAVRRAIRYTPPALVARARERRFYQRAGVEPEVVAMSGLLRDAVIGTYGVDPARIHHVPNGVDLDRFSPAARDSLREEARAQWGIEPGTLTLLFLGHNFRLKGLESALRAVAILRERGLEVRLLAGGKGTGSSQWRAARRAVRRWGCADLVDLTGTIHPALRGLAAADILVHPSWHDAFGNVVLEAMACALPVITTPLIGAAELIEDGVSGRIVAAGDASGIADGVLSLRDAEPREAMGAAARAVADRHGEERNFEQVLAAAIIAANRSAGPVR